MEGCPYSENPGRQRVVIVFIHLLKKYLWNTYCVPEIILGTEVLEINNTIETLVEETDGKQLTKVISVMHLLKILENKLGVCSRDQIRKIF